MQDNKVTTTYLKQKKTAGKKISMLTAYDWGMARMMDEVGIDILLVGDSLGMVVLGYENTLPVTMEEMIHHTRAVARGAKRAMVVGDMPFMSYQGSIEDAVRNAGRFIKDANASGVKVEGGKDVLDRISAIIKAGIPVMGHIGLTPQSIHIIGGYKVQGKTENSARKILEEALLLERAGVFSIVLECVPWNLAKLLTERLSIPTIGIGAGKYCDGQVLVVHDMLGFYPDFVPRHTRQFAQLNSIIKAALREYIKDVEEGRFPDESHSSEMDENIIKKLLQSE